MKAPTWQNFKQGINDIYELDDSIVRAGGMEFDHLIGEIANKSQIDAVRYLYQAEFYNYTLPILTSCQKIASNNPKLYTSFLSDVCRFCVYRAVWVHRYAYDETRAVADSFVAWKTAEINVIQKTAYYQRDLQQYKECEDLYPNLEYFVNGGKETRGSIILPIGDEFWDNNYPPNNFSGLDAIGITDEQVSTSIPRFATNTALQHNPALTGRVFTELHPYYNIPLAEKPNWDRLSTEIFKKSESMFYMSKTTPYLFGEKTVEQKPEKKTIWNKLLRR
jgi:hypothetical protein